MADVERKLLSSMTHEELQAVMSECQQAGRLAAKNNQWSEIAILRTRYYLAASYLLDPSTFELDLIYEVEDEGIFIQLQSIDGVMGHGIFPGTTTQIAYPLAMLQLPNN